MKDLLKVHTHYVTRVNSLRKPERALQKKLKEAQTELASTHARIAQLAKRRARWRVMAKAEGRKVKPLKKNIIRIQNPLLWCSGRYSAWVGQMYFELYQCRLSEAMVNTVIRVIGTALGFTLVKRPSSRTQARLRVEGECWAQLCAVAAMAKAKAEAQAGRRVFTICEGRDKTTARGWHFKVHSSHVTSRSGPVHLVNDAPVVQKKQQPHKLNRPVKLELLVGVCLRVLCSQMQR